MQARCPRWVTCVDMAMSDLSSAIHNTGHYHVRPRPVCLSPSCARSANNGRRLRPGFARSGDTLCTCGHQRFGISTATTLRPGDHSMSAFAFVGRCCARAAVMKVLESDDMARFSAPAACGGRRRMKRTMRRPTRRPFRGRLIRLGEVSEEVRPDAAAG